MNLTDDFILKCQKGSIIFLEDICAIKCATLGEIVDVGYSNFLNYLNVLTAQKPLQRTGSQIRHCKYTFMNKGKSS